jgi:hypothetical protein
MARPQVVVNVTAALPRRGDPTATGTAVLAFTGGTGPTAPQVVRSAADVTGLYGSTAPAQTFAAWVADALTQGAHEVIVVRVPATAPSVHPTTEQWAAGLAAVTEEYGASAQVAIPGEASDEAHAALLAHAADFPSRTVFLDMDAEATAAELAALAATHDDDPAAPRAGIVAPWVTVPAPGGATRVVPGSVLALGLVARNDAVVGHAGAVPAFDQGRNAGVIRDGIAPTQTFTAGELDALHDAGVSVIRQVQGRPVLYGWRSLSSDERFAQLSAGRLAGQLGSGIAVLGQQFLGRGIDGLGLLFAEFDGALRGYLMGLWTAGALYGADADDAFDVAVASVNTPASIAAGELRASVEAALTPHAERVRIDVTTSIAQEG